MTKFRKENKTEFMSAVTNTIPLQRKKTHYVLGLDQLLAHLNSATKLSTKTSMNLAKSYSIKPTLPLDSVPEIDHRSAHYDCNEEQVFI